MRRLLVLFTLAGALAAFGMVACGGEDKPPLTPDGVEPPPAETADAAAPADPSATPPAN